MRFKSNARGVAGTGKIGFKHYHAKRRGCPKQKPSNIARMRHWLAAVLVCSVVVVGVVGVFVPRADAVLTKLLPALMLILAYYFRRR